MSENQQPTEGKTAEEYAKNYLRECSYGYSKKDYEDLVFKLNEFSQLQTKEMRETADRMCESIKVLLSVLPKQSHSNFNLYFAKQEIIELNKSIQQYENLKQK